MYILHSCAVLQQPKNLLLSVVCHQRVQHLRKSEQVYLNYPPELYHQECSVILIDYCFTSYPEPLIYPSMQVREQTKPTDILQKRVSGGFFGLENCFCEFTLTVVAVTVVFLCESLVLVVRSTVILDFDNCTRIILELRWRFRDRTFVVNCTMI